MKYVMMAAIALSMETQQRDGRNATLMKLQTRRCRNMIGT
jgi:hypothetical protein